MRDILIVEDGLHERERLARLFAAASYSINAVESYQEAERLIAIEHFRLVLLDIGLGDKSGSLLFDQLIKSRRVPYIIILTGNPSIHLKQRFLDQGAFAYIVKASTAAESDSLLEMITSLLGKASNSAASGIPLTEFLNLYVSDSSRPLFHDQNGELASCSQCGAREYVVSFAQKTQIPPHIEGKVICTHCGREMDPQVG